MKVSVSLDRRDLVVLRRHARMEHGGNLSAAFAEAARILRQREARRALVELLGGPVDAGLAAAAADEQRAAAERPARRRRRRAA